jgi:5-formyltetrahydrofolate cyclo-ligase
LFSTIRVSRANGERSPRPYCFGLGYADAQLESIFPQPHDLPMDLIVTP